MKTYYYFVRDKDGHPRVTVCLLAEGDRGKERIARGIALCGLQDVLDKKEGKNTARKRAMSGFYAKTSKFPIRQRAALDVLCSLSDNPFCEGTLKVAYMGRERGLLSEFERRLLEVPK